MAQGTPNVAGCIPAGLQLVEHRASIDAGSDRDRPCTFCPVPQTRAGRLWAFEDVGQASQSEPADVFGPASTRGGGQGEASASVPIADDPTGVGDGKGFGSLRNADDLTESDLDNLTAVLDHEIAPNTMRNYRVQWNSFNYLGSGKGHPDAPRRPGTGRRLPGRAHRGTRPQARNTAGRGIRHRVCPQDRRSG